MVVKVVTPTRLLAEAAEVLRAVRDDVVVIGAAALEVALADAPSVAITPTRDIDLVVSVDRAADVVSHLEAADLRRRDVPYERGFTWVRGDLKVQLVRAFHPFPKPPGRGLPDNPAVGMAAKDVHQLLSWSRSRTNLPLRACVAPTRRAFSRSSRPPSGGRDRRTTRPSNATSTTPTC
jgi:hypothetical protein